MFDELEVAVKDVVGLDLHRLSDDEVSEAAVEIMRLRSALEAGEAALLAACERRRAWAADGARAAEAWAAGGMTDQSNSRLACGFHNRLRNQRPPP